ncbi:MAG: aminoglycoside phosphotransferase [Oceanospirillaceae bacterium]|nr:aminoglycoside phosphotransferase [Oceanospirillaceae bacterium]|tara:strand:+ start:363 stop:1379 length:1017 start_codon:yes stop_codon:yes gene_type:complete
MDQRRDHLAHWAVNQIQQLTGEDLTAELSVVSGDASFRRYFRLTGADSSWICVDAPPEKEDNPKFIAIARSWSEQGVHVPAVLSEDIDQGFMLLEDFGDQLLWPALHDGADHERVLSLYKQSIDELIRIQKLNADELPEYDGALLRQEVSLFSDWLCERQVSLSLSADEHRLIADVTDILVDSALAQSQVVVHRDYHSRNLMLCSDGALGVIDFQDAVRGAVTYDLVSLLRDCYVRWPHEIVDELTAYYHEKASLTGVLDMPFDAFSRAFDLMGMQRHLKAAGIFARLNIRDGKAGYLADIPNTCVYLREVAGRYYEFTDFCRWLDERFLPAMEKGLS